MLESGWGKFHLGQANNYFGIKAFARAGRVEVGPIAAGFVVRQTHEVVGGRDVVVSARFRSYRSLADSMRDHGHFLRANSRYAPAFAFSRDPNGFARAIAKAGYATDPAYADKLIGIMRANDLYRFDNAVKPEPAVHASVAALQRDLNTQLARLGARQRLAVDGRWDSQTDLAFRRACKVLGVAPRRGLRTYRIIAGADASLTEAEKLRASTEGAAFAAKLRARFKHVDPAPTPSPGPGLDPAARRRAFIAVLQCDLNSLLAGLGSRSKLAVSGKWDNATDLAFRRACRVLGVEAKRSVRVFRLVAAATASRTDDDAVALDDELDDDLDLDHVSPVAFGREDDAAPAPATPIAPANGAAPAPVSDAELVARIRRLEEAAQALADAELSRDGRRVKRKVQAATGGAGIAALIPFVLQIAGAYNLSPELVSGITAAVALVGAFAAGWTTPERKPSLPSSAVQSLLDGARM